MEFLDLMDVPQRRVVCHNGDCPHCDEEFLEPLFDAQPATVPNP